jgi:hypothetical protein
VAEIHAEHVDDGKKQIFEYVGRRAAGTDGRDNLGLALPVDAVSAAL